jgi:metallophosphoesterase superfamily enzyme
MLQLKPEGLDLADVASRPIVVCGRQLIADNSGALYWPGERALLVADLELADGSAGNAVRHVLTRLAEVMDRYEPARVIVIDAGAGATVAGQPTHMSAEDLQILRILQEDRNWIWVTGGAGRRVAPQLGGNAHGEIEIGGIALRARPTPGWVSHEIAGAMRPAAHLSLYGYSLRRACFAGNRHRLLMPAFGAPAGGTNVLDPSFRPLLGDGGMSVWMLGQEGLYPVATRLLAED